MRNPKWLFVFCKTNWVFFLQLGYEKNWSFSLQILCLFFSLGLSKDAEGVQIINQWRKQNE